MRWWVLSELEGGKLDPWRQSASQVLQSWHGEKGPKAHRFIIFYYEFSQFGICFSPCVRKTTVDVRIMTRGKLAFAYDINSCFTNWKGPSSSSTFLRTKKKKKSSSTFPKTNYRYNFGFSLKISHSIKSGQIHFLVNCFPSDNLFFFLSILKKFQNAKSIIVFSISRRIYFSSVIKSFSVLENHFLSIVKSFSVIKIISLQSIKKVLATEFIFHKL